MNLVDLSFLLKMHRIQIGNCFKGYILLIKIIKISKKVDFENPKVQNCNFSTKSVPDQCGFSNSAIAWGPKNRTNREIPVQIKK